MAKITEKRLYRVPKQLFIADGLQSGQISVNDTTLFVVGHDVVIASSTMQPVELRVKRIISSTVMFVGLRNKPIQDRSDVSMYLVADGAYIEAMEQQRPSIPEQEIERNTYDEEPIVARRVSIVDTLGQHIDTSNPLPVEATIVPSSIDTPIIYNVSALSMGTEYSQLLPNDTAMFSLRSRNNAKLQLAYAPTQTSTNFYTLMPGNIYKVSGVRLNGRTIYFMSNKDNTVVEIEAWT